MTTTINVNMRTKDIINAHSASNSIGMTSPEDIFTVTGICVVENGGTDRQKNPCDIGYIATDKGVFGFISHVMLKSVPLLADYLKECLDNGETCEIRFLKKMTKDEQEFFSFEVV